jgi:hypothetical protein
LVNQTLSQSLQQRSANLIHPLALVVEALVSQPSHQASASPLGHSVSPQGQPSENPPLALGSHPSVSLLDQFLGSPHNRLLHSANQQNQHQCLGSRHRRLPYLDNRHSRSSGRLHNHRQHSESQRLARVVLGNPQHWVPRIPLQLLQQPLGLASHRLDNPRLRLASPHRQILVSLNYLNRQLASANLRNLTHLANHLRRRNLTRSESPHSHPPFCSPP